MGIGGAILTFPERLRQKNFNLSNPFLGVRYWEVPKRLNRRVSQGDIRRGYKHMIQLTK